MAFDFWDWLTSNPLLTGLGGFALGGLPGGALGLGMGLSSRDVGRERERLEEAGTDLDEGLFGEEGVLASGNLPATPFGSATFTGFGTGRETIGGPPAARGLPDYPVSKPGDLPFEAQTIPGLDEGFPHFDIDEVFGGPQRTLDWFRGNVPEAGGISDFDMTDFLGSLGQTRESIAGMMEGGQVSQADILSGVDLPEADLSEVLAGRMAGITQVSRGREQMQREGLASIAGGSGGLENLRRQSETLGFEEATRRGTEGAVATGDIRMEEALRESQRANIQFGAASLSEQINAALRGEQMKQEGFLGGVEAEGLFRGEEAQTGIEQWNKTDESARFYSELGLVGEAEKQPYMEFQGFMASKGVEFNEQLRALDLIVQGQLGRAAALLNIQVPGQDWGQWIDQFGMVPPKTVRVQQ